MNLFIDTNTLLSFYHYSDDDLESLRKLPVLVNQKHINLVLPDQVRREFDRNREAKIADALKQLRSANLPKGFPQICRGFDDYEQARAALQRYGESRSKLIKEVQQSALNGTLAADSLPFTGSVKLSG